MRTMGAGAFAISIAAVACAPDPESSPEPASARSSALLASFAQNLDDSLANPDDELGTAIATSGSWTMVGVSGADGPAANAGLIHVFSNGSGAWLPNQVIGPSDALPGGRFGHAVALRGTTAIVGADALGAGPGAAYVFTLSSSTWSPQAKLTPSGAVAPAGFGSSVALDGDTVIVGCPFEDSQGADAGAAYVFLRTGSTWSQQARLLASDGGQSGQFGWAVKLDADRAFVSAVPEKSSAQPGSVYAFIRSAGTWTEVQKLQAPSPSPDDRFGSSMALAGSGVLWVTVPGVGAHRYFAPGGIWLHADEIPAPSGSVAFGAALAASEDLLVAADDVAHPVLGGRVHFFSAASGGWVDAGNIIAPDPIADATFGRALALDPPHLFVGAPFHPGTIPDSKRGAAYFFMLGLGTPCATSLDCFASLCVDGVCCNEPCDGPCNTCLQSLGASMDGLCGLRQIGAGVTACLPYACDGISPSCPTSCTAPSHCNAQYYCDVPNAACVPKKDPGAPCSEPMQCASTHCADGVCCGEECGLCRACKSTLTGVADGVCAPVVAGTDPHDACAPDPGFPLSCKADGLCDGGGACRAFAPPTTPCGPSTCSGNVVSGTLCNGLGTCAPGSSANCGTYPCLGTSCTTSCTDDLDCTLSAYCSTAGTCENRKPIGEPCTESKHCQTQFCVDGVCCNSACMGQCEWCGDPSGPGTCIGVVGEPPPGRPSCPPPDPQDPCSASECDGKARDTCQGFAGSSVICAPASCEGTTLLPEARCDGFGNCPESAPVSCGAYACGEGACKQSCASASDCAPGSQCNVANATCGGGAICDGDHTLTGPGGDTEDCSPFKCSDVGTCHTTCSSSAQCVEGRFCSSSGTCEPRVGASDEPGCACTAPGRRRPGDLGWLLALAVAGSARRARQRPRGRLSSAEAKRGGCCASSRTTTSSRG